MITKRFFKTKNDVEVSFTLPAELVGSSVFIVADFLNWQPVEMKRAVKTKNYTFKTRLPKEARFEFRYLVDEDQWLNDPEADQYMINSFGEENSVISTYQ